MKIYAGDDTGLLKAVSVETGTVSNKYRSQDRTNTIQKMAWGYHNQEELFIGTNSHAIEVYDSSTGELKRSFTDLSSEGNFVSLETTKKHIVSTFDDGYIRFMDTEKGKESFSKKFNAPLCCSKISPVGDGSQIAFGGKEVDLQIYDVNADKHIFKAKNVSHDNVDLRIPVWVTSMAFTDASGFNIAVGTSYHEIRRYDTRVMRKPVARIKFDEHPITSMLSLGEEFSNKVVAANSVGVMRIIDFNSNQLSTTFKGGVGSIRGMSRHPNLPYLAAAGLDRFVRVYDLNNGRTVKNIYLKQRLQDVLFSDEEMIKIKQEKPIKKKNKKYSKTDIGSDNSDESDDEWKEMEVVKDGQDDGYLENAKIIGGKRKARSTGIKKRMKN